MTTCRNPQHGEVCDCPAEFVRKTSQRYCCVKCREAHYNRENPDRHPGRRARRAAGLPISKSRRTSKTEAESCAYLGHLLYAHLNGKRLATHHRHRLFRLAGRLIDMGGGPG